jgi:predicted tellurium resistance membrane protein TerC
VNGIGLSGATKRVADHARSFVRLELQLAATEMKKRVAALGLGIALAAGAAVLAITALLIMFGGLLLLAAMLGGVGAALLRKGAKPVPEQAIEEAKLTTEAIRNGQ